MNPRSPKKKARGGSPHASCVNTRKCLSFRRLVISFDRMTHELIVGCGRTQLLFSTQVSFNFRTNFCYSKGGASGWLIAEQFHEVRCWKEIEIDFCFITARGPKALESTSNRLCLWPLARAKAKWWQESFINFVNLFGCFVLVPI